MTLRLKVLMMVVMVLAVAPGLATAGSGQPSSDLTKLEREVSLKLAHISDEGPTDPGRRAKLSEAHKLDVDAEKAIAAGAYDDAEQDLVKANAILGQLAQ